MELFLGSFIITFGLLANATARHYETVSTIAMVLSVLAFAGLAVAVWPRIRKLKSSKHNITIKKKYLIALAAVWICLLILPVMQEKHLGPWAGSGQAQGPRNAVDPDPTGTWTAGDRNSVYNRLIVRSSGIFSFETVDFTGAIKGGYSGRWTMSGNSVRFEWGGTADSGSCSGQRTGPDTLVFGATTFHN